MSATTISRPGRTVPYWVRSLPWKLVRLVISLVVVLTLTFFMIQLIPGDPIRAALGPDAPVSLIAERRHQLGLDLPLWQQYLQYWGHMLTGQFGDSLISQQPVSSIVRARLGNTATLVVASLVLTAIVSIGGGLIFGILTRGGRRSSLRFGFNAITGIASAIPDFLLAVALVFVFAITIRLFPVAGAASPASFVLPTLAITLGSAATMMRVVRSSTDVVLGQDYILVARAKRLTRFRIYARHALPNLLTAALTLGGLQLGTIVTGTIVVESVFAMPGLGSALVQGLSTRDYPVVQTIMMIFAGTVLVVNLIIDIVLGAIDPRSVRERS